MHPHAETMWEQEPEQTMTAASAATTQEVHLQITASESKLLPGKPVQMEVQGCIKYL